MRGTIAVAIVALLSFASASATAQSLPVQPQPIQGWHDGDPIPAGYHPSRRVRSELVLGGALTLVWSYAIASGIGAGTGDNALFVPVAGPFIEVGHYGIPRGNGSTWDALGLGVYASFDTILVLDGVVQAAAAVLLVVGLAAPKSILVRNDLGAIKSIRPVPLAASNMGGFGIAAQS